MDNILKKKYKLKSSENFEDYLKFIGVGLLSRKAACSVSPTVVLVQNPNGSYTFTMSSALKSSVTNFRLNEEFAEQRADGVKVTSIFKLEDGKLIQSQIEDKGRKSNHVREFTGDTLVVTTTVEGWDGVCTRTYELMK